METDTQPTLLDYCNYCLTRDRGLFKYSLQQSPSLKAIFQVEELLFCYVCTKFAQNAEEFIQKVGNAQKRFHGFAVFNATTRNTAKRQIHPFRHLTIQHSGPVQISSEDTQTCMENSDEKCYTTYSCGGKVHDPNVKVEVKLESLLQNSYDCGEHDFGDVDELPEPTFDMKDDLSLLMIKQELVAEEVDFQLLKKRVKKESGRRKGKLKLKKVKKEPRSLREDTTDYVEVIHLSHEEFLREREAAAAEEQYVNSPLKCEDCLKGFTMKSSYMQHMVKHSPSHGQYVCDVCKIRKCTNKFLENHMKYHQIRYKCKLCNLTRSHRRTIHDHYSACHGTELSLHKCPHCTKVYQRSGSLRKHVGYAHRNSGRAVCDYCQKSFANKVPLRRHMMLIHSIEPLPLKSHVCEECGKGFLAPSLLKKHLLKHTDKKEYYCVECDKSFKTDQSLKSHLTTATPHVNYMELRYPCPRCDKRFPVRRDVERHMNSIHLNHKPYQCDQCDRAYVSKWSLKDHTRLIHEGYKRPLVFPCQMCDKVFDRRQILKSHIRTHTGERPYQCSRCPANFAQSSVLHTHVKLIHLKLTRDGRAKQTR